MEWNQLLDQIIDILIPILATGLTALFSWLGVRIKTIYEEKVNTETKQKVVDATVKWVQQVYKDLNGEEKLKKAIDQAQEILKSKGINISDAEINMLIESSVLVMKNTIVQPDTVQEEVIAKVKKSEATE